MAPEGDHGLAVKKGEKFRTIILGECYALYKDGGLVGNVRGRYEFLKYFEWIDKPRFPKPRRKSKGRPKSKGGGKWKGQKR